MPHVFISYTAADVDWAEWIAWVLEEKGYRATIQQWDFRPGCNFVVEMQKAAVSADLTLAVISPKYLDSGMASAEWAAAFAEDPTGMNRKLIPVRIQEVGSLGLLKSVVYIDLVGKEAQSRCGALPAAAVRWGQGHLDPSTMTAEERLTEIGEILAAGVLRIQKPAANE